MKNENFFDSVVFPEVLDGLKNKKSKKTYENIKNGIEAYSGKSFSELTEDDGINYSLNLRKNGYAESTICNRMAIIRSFASLYEKIDETYKNPFIDICKDFDMNSCIDESKIPLQKEVDAFCKKCSPKVGLITKLVSILGLSSKDITTIKLTDIHMHNGEPYLLLEKNAYSRYVFIPEKLKNQIENYIQLSGLNPNGYIFFSEISNKKVSVRTVERWYKSEADINNFSFTLQDLRNAAASYMIANGANGESVQQALGLTPQSAFRYNKCVDKIVRHDATKYLDK